MDIKNLNAHTNTNSGVNAIAHLVLHTGDKKKYSNLCSPFEHILHFFSYLAAEEKKVFGMTLVVNSLPATVIC